MANQAITDEQLRALYFRLRDLERRLIEGSMPYDLGMAAIDEIIANNGRVHDVLPLPLDILGMMYLLRQESRPLRQMVGNLLCLRNQEVWSRLAVGNDGIVAALRIEKHEKDPSGSGLIHTKGTLFLHPAYPRSFVSQTTHQLTVSFYQQADGEPQAYRGGQLELMLTTLARAITPLQPPKWAVLLNNGATFTL